MVHAFSNTHRKTNGGMGPSLRTAELFISGLIVANAIVIGLETDNQEEELWAVSCSKKMKNNNN